MTNFPGNDDADLVLTESRTMRAKTIGRTDVLAKVKALALLPDGVHADIPGVASYFGVSDDAIESVIRRNRQELLENGMRVLRGQEFRDFATVNLTGANPKSRSMTVFTRRTILNVGQILTESEVAQQVRAYLLNVEEQAAPHQRLEAVERAHVAEARLSAIGVAKKFGLTNSSYLEGLTRLELARMNGEEPDIEPQDYTITADEYLTDKGVQPEDLPSARTRMGRTVAALYRARYSKDPQKIRRPIHGVHREVAVYTHRDIDLFDKAWEEVGRHYDVQTSITGDAA
ncbi:hypothetical protein ACWGCW_00520 [Streptomyces sp. NPDC054933]